VHLLGPSRGGAVVIEVAKTHPDVIRSPIPSDASCKLHLAETEDNRKADAFQADRFRELRATVEAGDAEGGDRKCRFGAGGTVFDPFETSSRLAFLGTFVNIVHMTVVVNTFANLWWRST